MLPKKLVFVDIETTGARSFYDRIIEIGILRVEDNKIVSTFNSLVNPDVYLPQEIEMLTGITYQDLEHAPTFRQIAKDIFTMIKDCIFVAHNVRFDYSFLKNEFKREEISFSAKNLCTVKLSRLLYPAYPKHNLDALIERFGFSCERRHRAFDDAKVLFDFFQKVQQEFSLELIEEAVNKVLKKPYLPPKLKHTDLETLPEHAGVYVFYAEGGTPLYIGKSKNVKERVLSHFSSDISSPSEMKIAQQVESIEVVKTPGELGALLLESYMIKKFLPIYNKKSRIKKELIALKYKENEDGYKTVYLEPITTIDVAYLDTFLGFFRSRRQAKDFLVHLCKEYSLCEKLLSLENTKSSCFAYRLNTCKGACIKKEKPLFYNLRFTTAFSAFKIKPWPFRGPVMIEEYDDEGNKEYYVLDKWCYLGKITHDKQDSILPASLDTLIFDLDVYYILKQYLRNIKNSKYIHQCTYEQLQSF